MNEKIQNFSSYYFYENKLKAHPSVKTQTLKEIISSKNKTNQQNMKFFTSPLILVDTSTFNFFEQKDKLNSIFNLGEIEICKKITNYYLKYVDSENIGIITPYKNNVTKLLNEFEEHKDLEIETVDAFQGREKEVIIISTARSNTEGSVGFLSDKERMNVAITRAKRLIILITDVRTMSCDNFLKKLCEYFKTHALVVPPNLFLTQSDIMMIQSKLMCNPNNMQIQYPLNYNPNFNQYSILQNLHNANLKNYQNNFTTNGNQIYLNTANNYTNVNHNIFRNEFENYINNYSFGNSNYKVFYDHQLKHFMYKDLGQNGVKIPKSAECQIQNFDTKPQESNEEAKKEKYTLNHTNILNKNSVFIPKTKKGINTLNNDYDNFQLKSGENKKFDNSNSLVSNENKSETFSHNTNNKYMDKQSSQESINKLSKIFDEKIKINEVPKFINCNTNNDSKNFQNPTKKNSKKKGNWVDLNNINLNYEREDCIEVITWTRKNMMDANKKKQINKERNLKANRKLKEDYEKFIKSNKTKNDIANKEDDKINTSNSTSFTPMKMENVKQNIMPVFENNKKLASIFESTNIKEKDEENIKELEERDLNNKLEQSEIVKLINKTFTERNKYLELSDFYYNFKNIIFLNNSEQFASILKILLKEPYLGLDSEWHIEKTSLFQISTSNHTYVFDLHIDENNADQCNKRNDIFIKGISKLFLNSKIVKISWDFGNDIDQLILRFPNHSQEFIKIHNFVDLLEYSAKNNKGYSTFCKLVLGKGLDKSLQKSNWSLRPLKTEQLIYAAMDSISTVRIYELLIEKGIPIVPIVFHYKVDYKRKLRDVQEKLLLSLI